MRLEDDMTQIGNYVTISEAKSRLLSLIREIGERDEVLAITRDGIPRAILLSPEKYEGFMETIEVLSDSKAMRHLLTSLKQARKGRWLSEGEVFGNETE